MLIMLNGTFGVGKTTIARRLVATLPNAMLYDPEHVGAMLRKLTNGIRVGAEGTEKKIKLKRGSDGVRCEPPSFLFNSIGADDSLALVAAWQRTERCVQALATPEFAVHVETGGGQWRRWWSRL